MPEGRIDTHQHLVPDFYREELDRRGLTAGGWPTPTWSRDSAISMMDENGIATGILSLSAPGVHFGSDDAARALARRVNEYSAELARDRPDRFGAFAVLTLPDVDGAIAEAAHAFDVLGADGVVLLSNTNGRYLGEPEFEPLWDELDRRAAVVLVHPTQPPMATVEGMPGPILDYVFDTTRTAANLVARGVLQRHPHVRVILAHAGGTLPYVADRLQALAPFNDALEPGDVLPALRRFWFDTALSVSPWALPALLAFADPQRITYGSDFPYAPTQPAGEALTAYGMSDAQHAAIDRGNAQALFPRLAG